jgi:hypothetical protein
MNENAARGPADQTPGAEPVEFGCDGDESIDIDESEMTPGHFDEATWRYFEKKYGRRRKTPPPPQPEQ